MKKSISILIVLVACVSTSLASSVTAKYDGMPGKQAVKLINGSTNHHVYAGQSQFTITETDDDGNMSRYLQALADEGTFYAYCIDFSQTIRFGQTHTWDLALLTAAPVPGSPMASEQAAQLSYLYDKYAGSDHQVELQMAIWEVLEETDDSLDILDGMFQATNLSTAQENELADWFAIMDTMDFSGMGVEDGIFALTNPNTQDFMTGVNVEMPPPPVVPEPMTLLGGLMGCGAVAQYIRRRRRA